MARLQLGGAALGREGKRAFLENMAYRGGSDLIISRWTGLEFGLR